MIILTSIAILILSVGFNYILHEPNKDHEDELYRNSGHFK